MHLDPVTFDDKPEGSEGPTPTSLPGTFLGLGVVPRVCPP